jgi:adenosine/AMP kinase
MEIRIVPVDPKGYNVILGQSHFIKTVEDIYEALITSMPGIKFGLAFCEASGECLIRHDGSDSDCEEFAVGIAKEVAAGHFFTIVLKGSYPLNVLERIKSVQEVVNLHCATANPVQVVTVETEQGRGVIGVVDGYSPKGVEGPEQADKRKKFLREIGYKR